MYRLQNVSTEKTYQRTKLNDRQNSSAEVWGEKGLLAWLTVFAHFYQLGLEDFSKIA
jgi:hypothetical protein